VSRPLAASLFLLIVACGQAPVAGEPAASPATDDVSLPPQRSVTIVADPPPPFVYWAPEGAEIRNHPTSPGLWVAFIDGEPTGDVYFGDDCGASRRQHWVGRRREDLPTPPATENWRVFEAGQAVTADARPDRTNIRIDPATQRVLEVACY